MRVGVVTSLSEIPSNEEWVFILESLVYSRDPQVVSSADANICLKGGKAVAEALRDIYNEPRLNDRKARVARPFAGFVSPDAAMVGLGCLSDNQYIPSEPLVFESAKSALKHFPEEGARKILEKLNWWGELPKASSLEDWAGVALLSSILESSTPASLPVFLEALEEGRHRFKSGARLGAACGLVAVGVDKDRLSSILANEQNEIVRECLLSITHPDRREGGGGRDDGGQNVIGEPEITID
jgi:hypothetical protein